MELTKVTVPYFKHLNKMAKGKNRGWFWALAVGFTLGSGGAGLAFVLMWPLYPMWDEWKLAQERAKVQASIKAHKAESEKESD